MKRIAKTVTLPGGEKYASKAEMERHSTLLMRERLGEIRNLRRQVKYPLSIEGRPIKITSPRYKNGRQCVYTADFVYEERSVGAHNGVQFVSWRMVVEESKGFYTEAARLRMAVFEAQYNIKVRRTGAQKMRKRKRAA